MRNGKHPKPSGNTTGHATSQAYETKDGMLMIGASNLRQQRRLWTVLERPDLIKRTNDERHADHDREVKVLTDIMLTRTAPSGRSGCRSVTFPPRACARWRGTGRSTDRLA